MSYRKELQQRSAYALVVEDDSDSRNILMMILERENIPVVGVENGLEALKMLVSPVLREGCGKLPAIIFLDMDMPVFNGWMLLTSLQALSPEIKRIPVIVTTGASIVDDPARYELLRKPLSADQIMYVVNKHVARSPSSTSMPAQKYRQ